MKNIDLILGDCLEKMKDINDNSIDLVVTSPPYYNAKDYSHWDNYEDYLYWLKNVFKEVYRITKKGRMCCVNISPVIEPRKKRSEESKRYPIPFDFVHLMCEMGWKFLEDIIWEKPSGSSYNRNGVFYRNRKPIAYKPNVVTEYIIVFQKPNNKLIDDVLKGLDKDKLESSKVNGDYESTNIWRINPETKSKHPAPFPLKLPMNLISYYSIKDEFVLDLFMGSGTTGVACINLNRKFIGIEKEEQYFKIAEERINKAIEDKETKLF